MIIIFGRKVFEKIIFISRNIIKNNTEIERSSIKGLFLIYDIY